MSTTFGGQYSIQLSYGRVVSCGDALRIRPPVYAVSGWLSRGPGWLSRGNAAALPPETKQAINPLIALQGLAEATWGEGSYGGLSREGYLANPVVHRCVRMIAEAAGSMPWLLYEAGEELDTHPLLGLLARPNP